MLTDGAWMDLEPLLEACRPKGRTPPRDLRRTLSAIVWRHENGAKWPAIPAELWTLVASGSDLHPLGPPRRVGSGCCSWPKSVGFNCGMTFLDGTSIRAHHKAAGAAKRGPTARVEMSVRRLAARVAATAPRRA